MRLEVAGEAAGRWPIGDRVLVLAGDSLYNAGNHDDRIVHPSGTQLAQRPLTPAIGRLHFVEGEKPNMSHNPYDYATRKGVHPISWEDFHGICKALAVSVSRFQPEIILPIGRGGYYPGTLLAHILQAEIYPVRVSRRVNDVVTHKNPQWIVEPPAGVADRRVLIVDEICGVGETILMVTQKATALGASSVKSAVLYAHTWGVNVPDYIGLITDALVLNPWDREIFRDGTFHFHPEYVEALAEQGLEAKAEMLIKASPFRLAKG